MSGCVLTLDGAVVSRTCKKHTVVSLSTMEARFIVASRARRGISRSEKVV